MKTILVTGGNRGIGLGVCKELAARGHRIILTARNEEAGLKAVQSISGNVLFHTLDIVNEASISGLQQWIDSEFSKLDVLINNAGIIDSKGLVSAEIEEIKKIMETNFYGPLRLNRAFIPLLRKSEDPRIINVSSGMGAIDDLGADYAGYRLSKSGLNAQTIMLARELPHMKINAVCPGWVRTDMGGRSAPRPVEKGAETIVWLALEDKVRSGKFYRDKKIIDW